MNILRNMAFNLGFVYMQAEEHQLLAVQACRIVFAFTLGIRNDIASHEDDSNLVHRYTAGVYSLLPGGMEALPKFDDSDFKIPSETKTAISCFGVTRTLETEASDDSDTDSPRHTTNGEAVVRCALTKKFYHRLLASQMGCCAGTNCHLNGRCVGNMWT